MKYTIVYDTLKHEENLSETKAVIRALFYYLQGRLEFGISTVKDSRGCWCIAYLDPKDKPAVSYEGLYKYYWNLKTDEISHITLIK